MTSVSGELIPFITIPVQRNVPFQPVWKGPKSEFIDNEILSLLENGVIIASQHEPDEFVSPIFLRGKRDGSFRMMLNLKTLHEHVQYHHFKMETIETVMSMMTPGCFMASIAVALFTNLGLLIHPDKSVLYPTQQIVFLEISAKFSYYFTYY